MKIIDNVIPPTLFTLLENRISSTNFPWYYVPTSYEGKVGKYSWSHLALDGDIRLSGMTDFLETLIIGALDIAGDPANRLHRIRLGLLTKTSVNEINDPHVDSEIQHKTGLIYLNNSDGNTILYNEKYDVTSGMTPYDYFVKTLDQTISIKESVESRKNRLLLFNGLHYHSSTTPTNVDRRITINFNYS
jgi:hypothetical protein